jgi:hypothetical protein
VVIKVCCPTCWTWSELGTRMSCKKCGTPLILIDGRRADEVSAEAPVTEVARAPEPPPLEVVPVGWAVRTRATPNASTDPAELLPPPTF